MKINPNWKRICETLITKRVDNFLNYHLMVRMCLVLPFVTSGLVESAIWVEICWEEHGRIKNSFSRLSSSKYFSSKAVSLRWIFYWRIVSLTEVTHGLGRAKRHQGVAVRHQLKGRWQINRAINRIELNEFEHILKRFTHRIHNGGVRGV